VPYYIWRREKNENEDDKINLEMRAINNKLTLEI
jgi:hypothetical protein